MGVHGLWRLIEPSGKPVPLETLENKVLAVDISIWLHQAVKGFQDSKGAPVPNAHLLGIYHRVCKLLYFRIKPVFVFDGGVPTLKKQTIAKRTQSKLRNVAEADRIQRQLLNTLLKHTAVSKVLTEKIEASIGTVTKVSSKQSKDNLYMLPPRIELDSTVSSSEDELQSESTTTDSSPTKNWDLHTIDMDSVHFKSLPVDVRHDILTDLKETRKQSSWGRLHELPKISDDFSVYQLNRLRKRQAVQVALEDAEKEMGGKSLSLAELESILKDQGVINNQHVGTRIASDETKKYLLVKDVKKAMEEARKNEAESKNEIVEGTPEVPVMIEQDAISGKTKADTELDEDLRRAIALSLESEPSTSEEAAAPDGPSTSSFITTKAKVNPAEFSFLDNFTDADFASSSSDEESAVSKVTGAKMSSAQSYMLEYSGLTPTEIAKIMNEKASNSDLNKLKSKKQVLPSISEHKDEISESKNEVNLRKGQMDAIDTMEEPNKSDKYNESKDNDNTVEVMSSTDSSDSEVEEKIDTKSGIDIVINPDHRFEQDDDLFNDIFQDASKPVLLPAVKDKEEYECISNKGTVVPQKALHTFINPSDQVNKEGDVLGDLYSYGNKNVKTQINSSQICEGSKNSNKKTMNIVIHVSEPFNKDDDLFSDVFVEEKQQAKEETKINAVVQDISICGAGTASQYENIDEDKSKNIEKVDMKKQYDEQQSPKNNDLNENKTDDTTTLKENVTASSEGEVAKNQSLGIKGFKKLDKKSMTEQELIQLKNELQREKHDLLNEKSSKERTAGNITDQMYQEAQELLELFGVPYIIAPMEAEAQCAFLDEIELTDGTITDDSDIWLFGGKTVYKNFFNQTKYVMEFIADNIKHHFKLTREQMILLALLVGSDYTTGLQGVGPVTAVEILAAFPPSKGQINEYNLSHMELLSGLKEFRSWFLKGKSPGPGRNALKSKLKNLSFTDNFPSLQVVEAYLEPKVETSREAFSWSKPNIVALIEFAREKFGWTRNKSEDILNPVVKRMEETRHQKSIKDYFKTRLKIHSGETESKMSKRVKSAITNMGRDPSEIIAEELEEELKKEPKKKRATRKKKGEEAPEFSKKKTTLKADTEKDRGNKDGEFVNDFSENMKDVKKTKSNKANLKKLKPESKNEVNQMPWTSQTSASINVAIEESINVAIEESHQVDEEVDISEKINHIRTRRKLKEAKAAVDVKKPKLQKEKTKKVTSQFQETIPEGLQGDEEVNLLSQIAMQSSQKVHKINKTLQDKIESLTAQSIQVPKPRTTQGTPSVSSQATPSVRRPIFRPTRVPRKEVIPQKEKDKTVLLRNKLKAIEVFRKGKHGPGYVPKRERKQRLPKAEAELSESSDE